MLITILEFFYAQCITRWLKSKENDLAWIDYVFQKGII